MDSAASHRSAAFSSGVGAGSFRQCLGHWVSAGGLDRVPGGRTVRDEVGRTAGVISFAIDGIHPHDLATIADRDQVCLSAGHHCAMPLMTRLGVPATARASFYVYTQKEEVDRLAASIKEAQRIFA